MENKDKKDNGVPCVLKRKKGILVLEIDNYGVVNISDEKCLRGICEFSSSKKKHSKSKKSKHSKHTKKEEKQIEQIEEEKEMKEMKDNQINKNVQKQTKKEDKIEQKEPIKTEQKEEKETQKEIKEEKQIPKETEKQKEIEIEKVETIEIQNETENEIEKEENENKIQIENENNEENNENETEMKVKEESKQIKQTPQKKQTNQPAKANKKPISKKKQQQSTQQRIRDEMREANGANEPIHRLTKEDEEEQVNYVASSGMISNGTDDLEINKEIAKGYLYVNSHRLEEACAHFDVLLRKHPNLLAAYLGRGSARAMMGDLQRALSDLNQAVNIGKDCGDAYKRRGQVRLALGQGKGAIEDFTKAIEINDEDPESYKHRGSCYHQLGMFDKAVEDLKNAARIHQGDVSIILEIALCYNGMGLVDEAIQYYTKCINTDDSFPDTYTHFGQLYRDMGCYVRARQLLERGIKLNPQNHLPYYILANVLASAGRHREALQYIQKAESLAPPERSGDVHRLHSTICLALGMNRECLQAAKKGYDVKDHSNVYSKNGLSIIIA